MYDMKKLLNIFSALLLFNLCIASVCLAQSDTHNYVVRDVMQHADGKYSVTTVEYYDGLGCKEQVVSNGIVPGSPSQALLTRAQYEGVERERSKVSACVSLRLGLSIGLLYKNDNQRALAVITFDA